MRLRSEKGQNLVEFALVVPLLLLIVIGIAEFGRAWMARNILTGAAREAARVAAVNSTPGAARSRGLEILTSASMPTGDISVVDSGAAYGTVTVTATYLFPITVAGFIPGLSDSSIMLTSTTTIRREF